MDIKMHAVGQESISYYVDEVSVDEVTFNQLLAAHEEQPNVDWYEYTVNSVRQWFLHDLELLCASMWPTPTDMQVYLDSLAGLLYINDASGTPQDIWTANPQFYHDGWNHAMNDIYALCLDKLNDTDKDTLIAQQQQWLLYRNQMEAEYSESSKETQYRTLGDMDKSRTYRLISIYFND